MLKKKFSCRVLSILLVAVMLCVTLVACKDNTPTPPAGGGTTPPPSGDGGTTPPPSGDGGLTTQGMNWELNATCHDPATSVKTMFIETWGERVNEVTEGQVNVTVYPSAVLAASTAALEAAITGAVDIAWCFSSFFPGQFPLADVVTLPMLGVETSPQATNVLWDLYDWSEDLQKELSNGFKLIMLYTNPANHLSTSTKEVTTLESMKGVKYRAPSGPITDILGAWGAVPIMMGPPDVYESIEKGVIDGYCFEYSGLADFKLQEVTKYYMDMPIYLGPFLLIMNQGVWDSFPADIQAAIDSVSTKETSLEMAEIFQADYDTKREMVLSTPGATLTPVSAEALAEFTAIANDYNADWAASISANLGVDGQAYLDKALELINKYAS